MRSMKLEGDNPFSRTKLLVGMGSGYLRYRFLPFMWPIIRLGRFLRVDVWDTAQQYAGGLGEQALGQYVKYGTVVTKIGLTHGVEDEANDPERWNLRYAPSTIPNHVAHSLQRLGRERIDILLVHCPSKDVHLGKHVEVLKELKAAGLLKKIGFSADSLAQIPKEHEWAEVVEIPIKLATQLALDRKGLVILNGVFRVSKNIEILRRLLENNPKVTFCVLIGSRRPHRIALSYFRIMSLRRKLRHNY